MKILIAFDKFKGALSAKEACGHAASALQSSWPEAQIVQRPLTDGGEGFVEILTETARGRMVSVEVLNARLQPITAQYGVVSLDNLSLGLRRLLKLGDTGTIAVIEMAQAAGLQDLIPSERNPWHTSTYGVGQLLDHAAKQGVTGIVLGIGGSATNDLGTGALQALGLVKEQGNSGQKCYLTPANWAEVEALASPFDQTPLPPLRIACDVDNTLLGPRGATVVFAAQKGLPANETEKMESAVFSWAFKLGQHFDHSQVKTATFTHTPGTGAAGGLGFGLMCAYPDTHFVSGSRLVLNWLNLEEAMAEADLVLTGEGSFDRSSMGGKGPAAILELAAKHKKPVWLLAGKIGADLSSHDLPPNITAVAISAACPSLEYALKNAGELLETAVRKLTAELKIH